MVRDPGRRKKRPDGGGRDVASLSPRGRQLSSAGGIFPRRQRGTRAGCLRSPFPGTDPDTRGPGARPFPHPAHHRYQAGHVRRTSETILPQARRGGTDHLDGKTPGARGGDDPGSRGGGFRPLLGGQPHQPGHEPAGEGMREKREVLPRGPAGADAGERIQGPMQKLLQHFD